MEKEDLEDMPDEEWLELAEEVKKASNKIPKSLAEKVNDKVDVSFINKVAEKMAETKAEKLPVVSSQAIKKSTFASRLGGFFASLVPKQKSFDKALFTNVASSEVTDIRVNDSLSDVLGKFYALYHKIYDDERLRYEINADLDHEYEEREQRRQDELIRQIKKQNGLGAETKPNYRKDRDTDKMVKDKISKFQKEAADRIATESGRKATSYTKEISDTIEKIGSGKEGIIEGAKDVANSTASALGRASKSFLDKAKTYAIPAAVAIGAAIGGYRNANALEGVASGESTAVGGYNAANTTDENGKVKIVKNLNLTDMTIGEIERRQALKAGQDGKLTAVGKYQFIPSTFKEQAEALGLSQDTKFTPEIQEKMGQNFLNKSIPEVNAYTTLPKDAPKLEVDEKKKAAQLALSKKFASIGVPEDIQRGNRTIKKGQSYYDSKNNRASKTPEQVASWLDKDRENYLNSSTDQSSILVQEIDSLPKNVDMPENSVEYVNSSDETNNIIVVNKVMNVNNIIPPQQNKQYFTMPTEPDKPLILEN